MFFPTAIRLFFAHLQECHLDFDCPGSGHLLISSRGLPYRHAFTRYIEKSQDGIRHIERSMIGARIKELRKQNKLSQQAFASLLTTSSGYISEVEQGKTQPGSNFLVSLKRAFPDLDLNWLLTGEGDVRPGGQEAMPVDADVLEAVIEAIEVCLGQVEGSLKPAKKAQVIVTLYEMVIADTEKKIEEGKVMQIVRLAL